MGGAYFGNMLVIRSLHMLCLLLLSGILHGQEPQLQRSQNGWHLSPHGTIRVLVIFAEVEYDQDPSRDPQPGGAPHWPKGELPIWRDELFDPNPSALPQGTISRYYHDISLGQYTVLGDHLDRLVVLRESEHNGIRNVHGMTAMAVAEANKFDAFSTRHGSGITELDLWKRGRMPGAAKEPGPDDPPRYDHIMLIVRNSKLTHGQGSVDAGSPGKLFGYESDSQSRFGAMNGLPFGILKHEFNHLLLGGNNFHSGGGNGAHFQSFFPFLQGGWSMMGAANSSLLTCSGWDRQRLGWRPTGAEFDLNVLDAQGRPVDGDLDPMAGDTGIFILRDLVTTGDVLRIRMPFIPKELHQQWLWIENHQGSARNGSPTDKFHYEEAGPCMESLAPGLFMVMQVEREDREGPRIFGGYSDYLRPMPAVGMYDLRLTGDTIRGSCPFGGNSIVFRMDDRWMNPLSGNHEQELPILDKNGDDMLDAGEHWVPGHRMRNGRPDGEMVMFGRRDHALRMDGKRRIGMDTNPSTANMMTLVSGGKTDKYKRGAPNVRTVYLNGISVEMLDMDEQGHITVHVRAGDTRIREDLRWCADSIVLPPLRGTDGHSLTLSGGTRLMLDRSLTPTRIDSPEVDGSMVWFSEPTRLTITEGASVLLEGKSTLDIRNGSEMHLLPGSTMELGRKVRLRIEKGSSLVVHGNAQLKGDQRQIDRAISRGRIIFRQAEADQ